MTTINYKVRTPLFPPYTWVRATMQALKEWQKKRPDLFVKRVYNVTGLDIYS